MPPSLAPAIAAAPAIVAAAAAGPTSPSPGATHAAGSPALPRRARVEGAGLGVAELARIADDLRAPPQSRRPTGAEAEAWRRLGCAASNCCGAMAELGGPVRTEEVLEGWTAQRRLLASAVYSLSSASASCDSCHVTRTKIRGKDHACEWRIHPRKVFALRGGHCTRHTHVTNMWWWRTNYMTHTPFGGDRLAKASWTWTGAAFQFVLAPAQLGNGYVRTGSCECGRADGFRAP